MRPAYALMDLGEMSKLQARLRESRSFIGLVIEDCSSRTVTPVGFAQDSSANVGTVAVAGPERNAGSDSRIFVKRIATFRSHLLGKRHLVDALTQAAAWAVNFQLPTVRIYNAFSGREY